MAICGAQFRLPARMPLDITGLKGLATKTHSPCAVLLTAWLEGNNPAKWKFLIIENMLAA